MAVAIATDDIDSARAAKNPKSTQFKDSATKLMPPQE